MRNQKAKEITFQDLREANITRQLEWPGAENVGTAFRGLEAAGEAGEFQDAVIALLLASASRSGRISNLLKKIARAEGDIAGNAEDLTALIDNLRDEAADQVISTDLILMHLKQPDLAELVTKKFNKTSEKVGLDTRIGKPYSGYDILYVHCEKWKIKGFFVLLETPTPDDSFVVRFCPDALAAAVMLYRVGLFSSLGLAEGDLMARHVSYDSLGENGYGVSYPCKDLQHTLTHPGDDPKASLFLEMTDQCMAKDPRFRGDKE